MFLTVEINGRERSLVKKRMKMEGSKAPVETVSLKRRKLKQDDLPKGGKEWLLQSVPFSAYVLSVCAGWGGNLYLLLKNVCFCNITLVYNLVNLGHSYSLIYPFQALVSDAVVSMVVRADEIPRSLICEIYGFLKT